MITGEKPAETQTPAPGSWLTPAFSPDGKRIAYVSLPSSPLTSPSTSLPNQLKVISFDGRTPLPQFAWPSSAGLAAILHWMPGSEAIDYVLTRNGVSNIWRQSLAGGAPKQITNFEAGQIFRFRLVA